MDCHSNRIVTFRAWRHFHLIQPSGCVCRKNGLDLVADPPEHFHLFLLRAFGVGRIVEWKVMAADLAGEGRADLICVAAYGNHRVDLVIQKLVKMLGPVVADTDTNLRQCPDGQRVDKTRRIGSGAFDPKSLTKLPPQNALGQVGAAGIAGAKNYTQLSESRMKCVQAASSSPAFRSASGALTSES